MLDRIPLPLRDLLLMVLPLVLGWAGSEGVPWLAGQHPSLSYLLAAVVAGLTAWLTPLTRSYGVGSGGGQHQANGPELEAPEPPQGV